MPRWQTFHITQWKPSHTSQDARNPVYHVNIYRDMTHDTWHMTHDTWHVTLTPDMLHLTPDTWHLTPDTWHLTPDTCNLTHNMWQMVGGEHSLLPFGCNDILKIWRKRITDWMNEWVTKVFVEQSRLYQSVKNCHDTY